MWLTISVLLFVFVVGLTIGGLLVAPREQIRLIQFTFIILFFLVLCYIGMIVGILLSGWINVRILEYLISVIAILFVIACITRFHPISGFFHPESRIIVLILTIIFFFMGFEWGLLGFRTIFTIASSILFAASLVVGMVVQLQIRQVFWRSLFVGFVPLTWLLIATVFKLF